MGVQLSPISPSSQLKSIVDQLGLKTMCALLFGTKLVWEKLNYFDISSISSSPVIIMPLISLQVSRIRKPAKWLLVKVCFSRCILLTKTFKLQYLCPAEQSLDCPESSYVDFFFPCLHILALFLTRMKHLPFGYSNISKFNFVQCWDMDGIRDKWPLRIFWLIVWNG